MFRRMFSVLSTVGMLIALTLTAATFGTTSLCLTQFDTTCCDSLIRSGYLITGSGIDCAKEYNAGRICNWTPTANPPMTDIQPAGVGIKGNVAAGEPPKGVRCEFYQWFCQDGTCSRRTAVPVGGDCAPATVDPNSASCTG